MANQKRNPKKLAPSVIAANYGQHAAKSPRDETDRIYAAVDESVKEAVTSISPRGLGKSLNEAMSVEELVQVFEQIDPHSRTAVAQMGETYFLSFKPFNIDLDAERLEKLGIKRATLTLAMLAIRLSRQFDGAFKEFGDKRTRDRQKRALLAPIPILREMTKLFGEVPDKSAINTPHPAKAVSELESLAAMLSWGEKIYEFLGANSLYETSRFALASLVYETTRKYLDREVSSLIAAALYTDDYDETRHRVWRISNYKRLQAAVPIATRFLLAVNKVASPPGSPR
jgi:hypothetical protein